MKKIFIAGCGGMLGEAFYECFKNDYELKCTDIDLNEQWLYYLDFRNYNQYRDDVIASNSDYIFHLGAYTDLEYCELHPRDTYDTNTESVKYAIKISNELKGFKSQTTNNRMELIAVIEGLKSIEEDAKIEIITDSKYVKNGINQWIVNWKNNGWKTAAKKPVKNKDLWQELDELVQNYSIEWKWVRGHSGHPGNEKADQLANEAILEFCDRNS